MNKLIINKNFKFYYRPFNKKLSFNFKLFIKHIKLKTNKNKYRTKALNKN